MQADFSSRDAASYRQFWKFSYAVEDLLTAAKNKRDYHTGRQKWWDDQKDKTIQNIKDSGIKIDESIVEQLSKTGYANNTMGAGRGIQVSIDNTMQAVLAECIQKVNDHKGKVSSYSNWMQIFEIEDARGISNNSLNLTYDDYVFFFGK